MLEFATQALWLGRGGTTARSVALWILYSCLILESCMTTISLARVTMKLHELHGYGRQLLVAYKNTTGEIIPALMVLIHVGIHCLALPAPQEAG
jgi:hypothetical protein